MALPIGVETFVGTTGPWTDFAGNEIGNVTVSLTPVVPAGFEIVHVPTGRVLMPRAITFTTSADGGAASITAPCVDATGLNITNFTYRLSVAFPRSAQADVLPDRIIQITKAQATAAGGPIDLDLLTDVPTYTGDIATAGLAVVALTGSYNDLFDKPAPGGGTATTDASLLTSGTLSNARLASVPKTALATAVQTSLGLADSALQSAPVTSVAGKTGVVSLVKADVGLGNVDNTSDANKPVSTAQAAADATKLALPTGTATAGSVPIATGTGTATAWGTVSAGVSALAPTATKTTAYTVAVGELAMMNVAGGATALTLPTAPADKAQVAYRAIGATTAVPLVITAGGTDTIGTSGATSASIPLADEVAVLQYQASSTRWLGVANVKTQASLDARYAQTALQTGKADAVGPWTDIVRAAQFGYSHTAAIASDSTADDLGGTFEWPLLSLKLLATQYPNVRMEHYQFDDTGQTYGTVNVVNTGAAATGGTVVDDGFSGTGNAVGAAADTTGTWQAGTGTVTKSSGTASPAVSSGLAFLSPTQDAKTTLDMIVTTAGFTGSAQAYRVGVAYTNAGLSGFGLQAILTMSTATSHTLTIRKYVNGSTLTTISSETLDFGLGNVTAQAATFSIELAAGTVTVIVTAGATTTTRTFTITTDEYAGLGYFAGTGTGTTVGAVTYDRLRVITAVIPTPTIKLYNASVAGKNPDYLRVTNRLAAVFPVTMDSILLSYGHNGWLTPGGSTGFLNDYTTTLNLVKAAQPNARLYIGSQNPEFPPNDASKVASHAARQTLLRAFARDNGCRYVPVLEAFEANATDNGLSLVQSDGVHPTNPPSITPTDGFGSTLWARTITGIAAPAAAATAPAALVGQVAQLVAGRWYPVGPPMQHVNLLPAEANEQAVPFIAGRTCTLTSLAVSVAVAGSTGAVVRVGIRADGATGRPGTLLQDAGTQVGTAVATLTWTLNVPVTAGLRYWATITVQGAATTRPSFVSLYNVSDPNFGADSAVNALANTNYGWRVSGVTGALTTTMTPDNMAGSAPKMVITAAT